MSRQRRSLSAHGRGWRNLLCLLGGGAAWVCIRRARSVPPPLPGATVLAGLLIAASVGLQHGKELPVLVRFKGKAHEMVASGAVPIPPIPPGMIP